MRPKFWGLHAEPTTLQTVISGAILFVLLIAVYSYYSDLRLAENPQDKLLPSFSQMGDAMEKAATEESKRKGDIILIEDTKSSLMRLAVGVSAAALVGLLVGLNSGLFPGMRVVVIPFVTFASIIPPLTLLPILFITFGVGELSKIMLIFIGLVFLISRDMYLAVEGIPRQQISAALTLGASTLGVTYRVVLPQVMPRLINTVRLAMGSAWLFLIAAEGLASQEGLGYRIFLVRRYLEMSLIIPYVMWITFLGITIETFLRLILWYGYNWYPQKRPALVLPIEYVIGLCRSLYRKVTNKNTLEEAHNG